ncbi:zinc finger protein [Macleaya cordata]|uniref:Zinc finger protein n=1 Tax=Macleaya cordata TaxID=56857 RepID=A0A200Q8M8_MACCD|nr:zinc finger protein [Macleaya cordata]
MENIQQNPKNSSSSSCDEQMNSKKEEMNTNPTSFFTCEICIEPVPLNQKFENTKTIECSHPFCTDCIAKYIQVKVEEDNTSEIKCPNIDCNVILDPLSCRSILPPKVFEKCVGYFAKQQYF